MDECETNGAENEVSNAQRQLKLEHVEVTSA